MQPTAVGKRIEQVLKTNKEFMSGYQIYDQLPGPMKKSMLSACKGSHEKLGVIVNKHARNLKTVWSQRMANGNVCYVIDNEIVKPSGPVVIYRYEKKSTVKKPVKTSPVRRGKPPKAETVAKKTAKKTPARRGRPAKKKTAVKRPVTKK